MLQNGAAALFWDPGVGKTSTTLAALKILFDKGMIQKVLLLAPLSICHSVWPGQVEEWDNFKDLKIVVAHGKDREEAARSDAHIVVTNFASLDWLLGIETKPMRNNPKRKHVTMDKKKFKEYGFDVLVIDELTKFKNHGGVRFKALKEVLGTFRRRYGLTGSPASNGLMGLFGQCYVLDQGRSLGQYITHYRNEYFLPSPNGFDWILQEDGEKRIYERLRPLVHRAEVEPNTGTPELIKNVIKVSLPDKIMSLYKELDKEFLIEVEGRTVMAPSAGAKGVKLRQMANGAVYLTPELFDMLPHKSQKGREWVSVHDEKVDALDALVEELQGNQLLVAYEFNHDEEKLRKAFPKATFVCDYPGKKIRDFERIWNEGGIELAFGNPQSMGHGLNLQKRCYHVALFGMLWDYEVYDQFIRRVRRSGNPHKYVYAHHIVAASTVDERVMAALEKKKATQEDLFNALKRRTK